MHYTLCDLFSDLVQNSVEADSTVVTVRMERSPSAISLVIEDDGKGMSPEELARAQDPFYTDGVKHPGRKIGLGIPFLIQTAESTGGSWKIESVKRGFGAEKAGTRVECRFDLTNIDTPPAGDVSGFFAHVLTFDGRYEMAIDYRETKGGTDAREFTLRRSELLEALDLEEEGGFTDANSYVLLGQFIESLMEE